MRLNRQTNSFTSEISDSCLLCCLGRVDAMLLHLTFFRLKLLLFLSSCALGFDLPFQERRSSSEGSLNDVLPCRIIPSSASVPFNWFCHSSSSGVTVEGLNGNIAIEKFGQIQPHGPFVYGFKVPLQNQGPCRVLLDGQQVAAFFARSEDLNCPQSFDEFDKSYSCNLKEISLLSRYFDWWPPKSVTRSVIRKTIAKIGRAEMAHVVIVENKIYRKISFLSESNHEAWERIFRLLKSVARKVKLPNVEFLLHLSDKPVITWDNLGAHVFGPFGTDWHHDIPLPTNELIGELFCGMNLRMAVSNKPWAARKQKLYFRGMNTSKLIGAGKSTKLRTDAQLRNLHRVDGRLDLFDMKFLPVSDERIAVVCKEGTAGLIDTGLQENKYSLHVDQTSRYRMHTLLTSGSAVVKVKEPYYEYYYEMMKPFRNYVELRNAGNLMKNVEWFMDHDLKMKKMAEEGLLFAFQHLQVENILCWTAHALRRVKEGLAFEPVPREGMELINPDIRNESCQVEEAVNIGRCSENVKRKNMEVIKEVKLRGQGCVQLPGFTEFLQNLWDPSKEKIVLFNIGANKGYNQLEWMEMWVPQLGKGPMSWGEELISIYGQDFETFRLCGICRECKESVASLPLGDIELPDWFKYGTRNNGLEMYAVEPSPANFNLLEHLKVWSKFDNLHLINAAVSNVSLIGKFVNSTLGNEVGRIQDGGSNLVDVQIWTLDRLVDMYHLPYIHYLKIDTEGHDALVLLGGRKTLDKKLVAIIEFEYNNVGPWKGIKLENTVEQLDSSGYDCFLKVSYGQPRKTELLWLTKCWTSKLEYQSWSNVLCYDRRLEDIGKYMKVNVGL